MKRSKSQHNIVVKCFVFVNEHGEIITGFRDEKSVEIITYTHPLKHNIYGENMYFNGFLFMWHDKETFPLLIYQFVSRNYSALSSLEERCHPFFSRSQLRSTSMRTHLGGHSFVSLVVAASLSVVRINYEILICAITKKKQQTKD